MLSYSKTGEATTVCLGILSIASTQTLDTTVSTTRIRILVDLLHDRRRTSRTDQSEDVEECIVLMIVNHFVYWINVLRVLPERTQRDYYSRSTLRTTDFQFVLQMDSWFRTSSYVSRDFFAACLQSVQSHLDTVPRAAGCLSLKITEIHSVLESLFFWHRILIEFLDSLIRLHGVNHWASAPRKSSRTTKIKQVNTSCPQQKRVNINRVTDPISCHEDTWT